MSLADLGKGCAPVLITAEIKGPEVEGWYCPAVIWSFPDGTEAREESDCPSFERRHECVESQAGCGVLGWRRLPDGSVAEDRKDCPCTVIGYPRLWTRRLCAPARDDGGWWQVGVRLEKSDRTVARADVRFLVR